MKHFILSLIISSTLSLSTFSMEAPQELTPLETSIDKLWTGSRMTSKWEKISVHGMTYRKGEVPGDNDCGIHSLNALFPESNLSRSSILDTFKKILENPQHKHHVLLKDELAGDLISILKNDLVSKMYSAKPSYPQILEQFPQLVDELEKDLFTSNDHYIQLTKNDMTTLETYINCFRDENVLFISVPKDNNNGILGLVCTIYDFSIQLINYATNNKHQIFMIGQRPPQQNILYRDAHFSPLCPIHDVDARDRLATWYANEVILKALGVFKTVNVPSTNLEELRRMVGQKKMSDRNILANQKTQPLAGSPYTSNTHNAPKTNAVNSSYIKVTDEQQEDNKLAEGLIEFVKIKKWQDNSMIIMLKNEGHKFDDSRFKRIVELARTKAGALDKEKGEPLSQEKNHTQSPRIATLINVEFNDALPNQKQLIDDIRYFIKERNYSDNSLRIYFINKGHNFDGDIRYKRIIASVRSSLNSAESNATLQIQENNYKESPKIDTPIKIDSGINTTPKTTSANIPNLFQEVIRVSKNNEIEYGIVMPWAELIMQLSTDPNSLCFGHANELLEYNSLFG